MNDCPPDELLERLGSDAMDPVLFLTIEEHVEGCPRCHEALERLAGDSPQCRAQLGRPPEIEGLEIGRELGRGGTGVVYEARQADLGRVVAVKVVGGGPGVGPRQRRRWLREARAMAGVEHPNVVPIHQVGEQDGWLYLVLKRVAGGTLDDRLAKPLEPAASARLIEQAARGVEAVHRAGFLHLDLKPSNLLLDGPPGASWPELTPLVADFGLARLQGRAGRTSSPGGTGSASGTLVGGGTPQYMAPEQAGSDRDAVGPAADVYGLGSTLYHLLTGRPPFLAATAVDTLIQVREREPALPRALNAAVPRDLETVCLKCLRKEPSRRYATAAALADDLRRWLDGAPIQARRVWALERAWRACRRRPAVAGLAAALALALVAGLAGFSMLRGRAETERLRTVDARRRAGEFERITLDATDQLRLLLKNRDGLTNARPEKENVRMALKIKETADNLRASGPAGPSELVRLGALERELYSFFLVLKRPENARSTIRHAVTDLREALRQRPDDRAARAGLAWALIAAGGFDEVDEGRREHAIELYREASRLHDGAPLDFEMCSGLSLAYVRLLSLAEFFLRRGSVRQAREAQRAAAEILGRFAAATPAVTKPEGPADVPKAERQVAALMFAKARSASAEAPAEPDRQRDYERFGFEWLCASLNPFSMSPPVVVATAGDDEARAEAILSTVRAHCLALGLPDSALARACIYLTAGATAAAYDQRKLGQSDEARKTAGLLLALARRLVRECPDRPDAQRVLSEAYAQEAKVAWSVKDRRAIGALERAIAAAREAVRLDPSNQGAQVHARVLAEKLVNARRELADATVAAH